MRGGGGGGGGGGGVAAVLRLELVAVHCSTCSCQRVRPANFSAAQQCAAWEIGERWWEEVGRRRWERGQAMQFTVLSEARPLSEIRRAGRNRLI